MAAVVTAGEETELLVGVNNQGNLINASCTWLPVRLCAFIILSVLCILSFHCGITLFSTFLK